MSEDVARLQESIDAARKTFGAEREISPAEPSPAPTREQTRNR